MYLPFYWLYIWQLKEYRINRLLSHFRLLSLRESIKLLVWGLKRKPTFTSKMIVLTVLAVLIGLGIVILVAGVFSLTIWGWLIGGFVGWMLSPFHISVVVGAVSILERPVKQKIITQAFTKSRSVLKDTLVIGITGSYGKTTTKEFLFHILKDHTNVQATPNHVNQTLPMAQFVNSIQNVPDILIVEYASYGKGNIAYDAQHVITPKWAILTGIAPQHLELFGGIEKIVEAKLELVENVPIDAPVFYNADDERLSRAIEGLGRKHVNGFHAKDIESLLSSVSWGSTLKGAIVREFFASNIAGAVAVAKECSLNDEQIASGLEEIAWLPQTLQPIQKYDWTIFDDSYSCNPYGFEKLISFVGSLDYRKKILITSGVIELGEESTRINNQLSKQAQEVFNKIFVTSEPLSAAWEVHVAEKVSGGDPETIASSTIKEVTKDTLIVWEGRIPELVRQKLLALE